MNNFLDKTGLTYFWGKIKAWVQGAFVSNVSISGNKVRVTKNGSNTDLTVPYATKAAQDSDGNAISTNYLKLKEPLMPTNTFSGDQSKFYLEPVMDCLWAADKRFTTSVTITDANQNVTTTTGTQLFRGNYSGATPIKAGDNCTIKIIIQAKGDVETEHITTYVDGYLIVNFYYTGLPKSISGRIYKGAAGSKTWKNISFDKQKGDRNGIYISHIGANTYASIIELNIECQTLATDPYMTMVSSVEWWNTRADVNQYPFVNKYTSQTLYYPLTANEGIVVPSGKSITVGGKDVLTDHQDISNLVPNTRKVNGKALSADITLTANDVNALPSSTVIPDDLADLNDDTTHRLVTDTEKSTWNAKGTYSKPSDGIPKTDLTSAVQTSLDKADTALQSFTESDPVFTASAAHGITSSDISNWNSKTSNVGTITGVSVNGTSVATSGVANITSVPASILNGTIPSAVIATTQSQGDNSTKIATTAYVDTAITSLPEPMVFKGSLGTGGTITTLPAASSSNEGYTYKVITAGTYASQTAKIGDTFISDGSAWILIPSGDEPSGTVTSIAISATSPIAIDNSAAITTSGTRTIFHATSGVTAGTYRSVTVNATGHITGGTNPTTLSGYGITDAYTKTEADDKYVTALSTNGNNLTWTKDGTTNNITVPYATSANSATKIGSSTVGSSTKPVYIMSGTPTVINSISGKTIQGSGINSLMNDTNGLGINPAINGAGMNISKGGDARFLIDGEEIDIQDSYKEYLFDGLNSTYLCPFNLVSYIVVNDYVYDNTKNYHKGAFVIFYNSSNQVRWYRSLVNNNIGHSPSNGVDNAYWEYVSCPNENYATGLDVSKITKLEILVTLKDSGAYENGVSLYWRTRGQHPKYLTIEKYDSTFTELLGTVCTDLDMTGESITSVYCGLVAGTSGYYYKFTFSEFTSNNYWAFALNQLAFTGNIGGLEKTVVMRKGGVYSEMYGDFYPHFNDSVLLGKANYRWSTIYGVKGDFSGYVTLSSGMSVANLLNANGGISIPNGKTVTIGGKAVLTGHQDISGLVPNTRKVNNKALSADITLTASDVNALSEDIDVVLVGESLGNVTFNEGGNT